MEDLHRELLACRTVDEVVAVVIRTAQREFGEERVAMAANVAVAIGVLLLLYVVSAAYRVLFAQPRPPQGARSVSTTATKADSTVGKKKEQGPVKGHRKAAAAAVGTPADGTSKSDDGGNKRRQEQDAAPPAAAAASSPSVRNSDRVRDSTVAECTPLRGVPLCGACAISPDGRVLVAASRDKRAVRVYPLFAGVTVAAKTKQYKAFETLSPDEVPPSAVITGAVFNPTGSAFVLLDMVSRHLYSYRCMVETAAADSEPKVRVTFLRRSAELPASAVAQAGAGHEDASLSEDATVVYFATKPDGLMDAYDTAKGTHLGHAKAKVGNTAVWAGPVAGGLVLNAGSYIHDLRVLSAAVHPGGGHAGLVLNKKSLPKAHLVAISADGTRAAVQLAGKSGTVDVWDLEVNYGIDERPKLLASFMDSSFCEADQLTVWYPPAPDGSRRRDLHVALVKGGDFVAYTFASAHAPATKNAPQDRVEVPPSTAYGLVPRRTAEVHGAHDGEAVRTLHFGGYGTCVATSSEADNRNIVRLWPLV